MSNNPKENQNIGPKQMPLSEKNSGNQDDEQDEDGSEGPRSDTDPSIKNH